MWGTPRKRKKHSVSHKDHPHVCGEHGVEPAYVISFGGSSPRMWGTRIIHIFTFMYNRIIPTYVGNTDSLHNRPPRKADHPHVCGEHAVALRMLDGEHGSSPRMWGTLHGWQSSGCRGRIIPTYVGNTSRRIGDALTGADHPHVCGEHGS